MAVLRENCIVLDTSILPKRPCMSVIESFVNNELCLDMSLVTYIQPHNVKNVVYLGIRDKQEADKIASGHHLKHFIESDGKKFPIPIYVENSAVDVRIHDLPLDMDNMVIVDHLRQYGEVIAIRTEVWKSYFPGFSNGVRVVRMKLNQPIPSYITVDDEPTLVSYRNQVKTCRNCGRRSHPKLRCSEVASTAATNTEATETTKPNIHPERPKHNTNNEKYSNNNTKTTKTNRNHRLVDDDREKQWPSLTNTTDADQCKNNKAVMNKRQRSIDSDTASTDTKKINVNDSSSSDSDCSLTTVNNVCPNTQLQLKLPSYDWITDDEHKRALIEDYKLKINDLLLAQQNLK